MIYIEKNSKKATPRNLDKQIFFIILTHTMQEHTPAFYDLELYRAKLAYEMAHSRLIFEQQNHRQHSIETETHYINTFQDYILATQNTNTRASDNVQYIYKQAYRNAKQKRPTPFQRLLQFFR